MSICDKLDIAHWKKGGRAVTAIKCSKNPRLLGMEVDPFYSIAASVQLTLNVAAAS